MSRLDLELRRSRTHCGTRSGGSNRSVGRRGRKPQGRLAVLGSREEEQEYYGAASGGLEAGERMLSHLSLQKKRGWTTLW